MTQPQRLLSAFDVMLEWKSGNDVNKQKKTTDDHYAKVKEFYYAHVNTTTDKGCPRWMDILSEGLPSYLSLNDDKFLG